MNPTLTFRKHLTGILFTGLGTFMIIVQILSPVPANVKSYTDHFLYNIPIGVGLFLIMIGWMLDTVENLFC